MNPVSIVTIASKHKLYKKDEEATSIELIKIEEAEFELVSQKGLYEVGDAAVYIQPDFNLSDIPLFESFLRPNGDESKSILGKVEGKPRRIRAKKFTLSKEPNGLPVYSNGILLPYGEVISYLDKILPINTKFINSKTGFIHDDFDLTAALGVTKYEEPEEVKNKSGYSKPFPKGVYKTDENNILKVGKSLQFPITLIGTEKVDGSSITIGITPEYPEGFICSRNLMKQIYVKKVVGKRTKTFWEKLQFWRKFDLNIYREDVNEEDIFVREGFDYLSELHLYGEYNLILRGELRGKSCKGSGNKYNPASKLENGIEFFGADKMINGVAEKLDFTTFSNKMNAYDFPQVKVVFNQVFYSLEDLLKACDNYFVKNKIEGIVVRTLDSKFSAKVMNLEYDSKK